MDPIRKAADILNEARIYLLREFPASPETGEVVDVTVRDLFNKLSDAQAACETERMESSVADEIEGIRSDLRNL
jgi:hypothetical protein